MRKNYVISFFEKPFTPVFICILLILYLSYLNAQDQKYIDSLKNILRAKSTADTERVYIQHEIGMQYYLSMPETALYYWRKNLKEIDNYLPKADALEKKSFLQTRAYALGALAYMMQNANQSDSAIALMEESFRTLVELGDLHGAAQVLSNLSSHYSEKAEYQKSVNLCYQVIDIGKKANNYKTIAFAYQNIGIAYRNWGKFNEAIHFFNQSLRVRDSLHDDLGMGYAYFDLAVIYKMMKEIDYSLLYFLKSLRHRKIVNDVSGMGASENEIAAIFLFDKVDYSKADYFLALARKHLEKVDDIIRLGFLYSNVGNYFLIKNKIDSAQYYYEKALGLRQKAGDVRGIALAQFNLGKVYVAKKNWKAAEEKGLIAYAYSTKKHDMELMMKSSGVLHTSYAATKNWEKAYFYLSINKNSSDSVLNEENQKAAIKNKLNFDFEKKQDALKAQQEKETMRLNADKKKQRIIIVFSLIAFVIVVVFSIAIYSRLQVIRKQKSIIETQKALVEEKQNEILDSIRYAKRIQNALITSEKYIQRQLEKQKF
jgi:tetratricopeptide (TPR) repeat protein